MKNDDITQFKFLCEEYYLLLKSGASLDIDKIKIKKYLDEFSKLLEDMAKLHTEPYIDFEIKVNLLRFDLADDDAKEIIYKKIIRLFSSKKSDDISKYEKLHKNFFWSVRVAVDFFRSVIIVQPINCSEDESFIILKDMLTYFQSNWKNILNLNNDRIYLDFFDALNFGFEKLQVVHKIKLILIFFDFFDKLDMQKFVSNVNNGAPSKRYIYTFFVNMLKFLQYLRSQSDKPRYFDGTGYSKDTALLKARKFLDLLFRDTKWGFKEIEILNLRTIDSDSRQTSSFRTGSKMKIDLDYSVNKIITGPLFIFKISSRKANELIVITTRGEKIKIKKGKNNLSLLIENLPLNPGEYYLSIYIFNSDTTYPYDMLDESYAINVFDESNDYSGLVRTKYAWDFRA